MAVERKHLLQSLIRLEKALPVTHELLVEHLKELLGDADKANRTLTNEQLYRSQGKAQNLELLIHLLTQPEQELKELIDANTE